MKNRRKWKIIFNKGHPLDFKRVHDLGDRTRVSQAATVRVQTMKYLCALRRGGRLSEFGSVKPDEVELEVMMGNAEQWLLIISNHQISIVAAPPAPTLFPPVNHVLLPFPGPRWS